MLSWTRSDSDWCKCYNRVCSLRGVECCHGQEVIQICVNVITESVL